MQSIREEPSVRKLFMEAGIKIMATATETKPKINFLEAEPRQPGNKNHARRVRRGGKIPAGVYGAGKNAVPGSVEPRQGYRIVHSETGHKTTVDLALDGQRRKA